MSALVSSCSCTHVAHVLVDLLVWQVTKFVRVRILVVDELAEERDVDEREGRVHRDEGGRCELRNRFEALRVDGLPFGRFHLQEPVV